MEFLNCLYHSENKAKINMHRLQNKGEKLAKQLIAFLINTLQQYFRNAMKVKVFRRAIG